MTVKRAMTSVFSLLTLLLLIFCAGIEAQDEPKQTPKGTTPEKPAAPVAKKKSPVDEAQESAALAFAREHHPELADLLTQLSTNNRREYVRAVRELSLTATRLDNLKKTAPKRYPAALESWKLDSRIKLLAAKTSMSEDPAIEAELKAAIKSRIDLRLQELTSERDRLDSRLKKINSEIHSIETDPAKAAESDLQKVKASVTKESPQSKKQQKKEQRKAKRAAKAAKAKDAEKTNDGKDAAK